MKINIPLYLPTTFKVKKKNFAILNLNEYRNWHYLTNNKIKKAFKEYLREDLQGKTFDTPYGLHMTVYYKRLSDLDNWITVVTKFFNDSLVDYGCVPDDNMNYYTSLQCNVGGKDTENPRVEISIVKGNNK